MTDIRNLRPDEIEEAIRLSEFAFQLSLTAEERAERVQASGAKPERQWGCFEDGRLAAKLVLLDLKTYIHGRLFAMGGIAGVATWPEYRRQGFVAKLLKHSLQIMKERGQTVSYLHPFAFGFYRKFGWETYASYKKYELTREQMPAFPSTVGRVRRIGEDWESLSPLYEAYASRYNGTTKRTGEWWKERIFAWKKGQTAVYDNAAGEARGYMLYQVKERTFTVHEMVFLDEEARRGLWNFIKNHDSMVTKVELQAPEDDELAFLLPDPRVKQELVPYFMARIVDLAAFVGRYPFAAAGGAGVPPVLLRVRDEHAPWNDGVFRLAVDGDGGGSLTPAEDVTAVDGAAVTCSIGALAAMLIGNRRPRFLLAAGLLEGPEEAVEALERVVPSRTAYLLDFF
ncbi:GNAT family N-acetyltransferase [Paenibacillus thermotolerans]|uniref:GNAT family N-acetyltransferase n=1 Tax=Paenibacillus thermotolerans TaxID=3027807 RepID=UPI0023678F03|nr:MULTISPECIES: GNAT family N-acetyltransferase [unclassified Paenibacillus]